MSRARDLADSADLNFDDGTLVIDSGNNRVGIGTASPDALLHLAAHPDSASLRFEATDTTINPGQYYGRLEFEGNDTGTSASGIRARIDALSTGGNGESALVFNTSGIGADSDNEAARIDSSGNLLVGKTSSALNTVGAELRDVGTVVGTRDSGEAAQFQRRTNDGAIVVLKKDGTTVGVVGVDTNRLTIGDGDVGLKFSGDLDNIQPHNTTTNGLRDNAINLGSSANRFKDLYLSGGVYLGGTGSANKLDDYEEGTWTPTIGGTTTNPSSTAESQNAGFYTKVGRQVFASFRVEYTSVSGGSGVLAIGGLPFNVNSNNNYRSSGNISFFRGVAHGGNRLAPHTRADNNDFLFYKLGNTTEFDIAITTSDLSSSVTLHGHITYIVD